MNLPSKLKCLTPLRGVCLGGKNPQMENIFYGTLFQKMFLRKYFSIFGGGGDETKVDGGVVILVRLLSGKRFPPYKMENIFCLYNLISC